MAHDFVPDQSSPNTSEVRALRFYPAERRLRIILYILMALLSAVTIQRNVADTPSLSFHSIILLALGTLLFVLSLWSLYYLDWKVETQGDGLYVQYLLGRSRIIPWRGIHKISMSQQRGRGSLSIYGDIGARRSVLLANISISYSTPGKQEAVNALMAVIVEASHLTKSARSFFPDNPTFYRDD